MLNDEDDNRQIAALTNATVAKLAQRRAPRDVSRQQAVQHAGIRRLALALRES